MFFFAIEYMTSSFTFMFTDEIGFTIGRKHVCYLELQQN